MFPYLEKNDYYYHQLLRNLRKTPNQFTFGVLEFFSRLFCVLHFLLYLHPLRRPIGKTKTKPKKRRLDIKDSGKHMAKLLEFEQVG